MVAMKFFVEFQLKPGNKTKIMEAFELRGPNRNPGVTPQGAWIAKNEEVIYVLAESADEDTPRKCCPVLGKVWRLSNHSRDRFRTVLVPPVCSERASP